jgi:hypothetical protein
MRGARRVGVTGGLGPPFPPSPAPCQPVAMDARTPDAEPMRIRRLLDRLLAVRARRDAEPRWSDRWRQFDAELHAVEREVFRAPVDDDAPDVRLDRAG